MPDCGTTRRAFLALFLAAPAVCAQRPFTEELWTSVHAIYSRTLEHPFLKGLADGSLPRSRFEFYLIQDELYLRAFAQALSILASKAPREEWAMTLNQHAAAAIQAERELHDSILKAFGVPAQKVRTAAMAPTNLAYTNHLLAAAHQRSFGEGLAAVLPCYWIYWEAGKELKKRGSKDPQYQRWIDMYSGEEYGKVVRQVLDMMNAESGGMTPEARHAAARLFEISSRYEWMFWDMAWREEAWPP